MYTLIECWLGLIGEDLTTYFPATQEFVVCTATPEGVSVVCTATPEGVSEAQVYSVLPRIV